MAPRRTQRALGGDTGGQMMMLSAIVLLIGFVALTGMVARVNQLATQTAKESHRTALDEAQTMKASLDSTLTTLGVQTATVSTTSSSAVITATSPTTFFTQADVGLRVKSSTGNIPNGAVILSVQSASQATLNRTATGTASVTATLWRPGFALTTATAPTFEQGVIAALQQMEKMESARGIWMDYAIYCGSGATTTNSLTVIHLFDGTVWVELKAAVLFTRSTPCATADPLTG